MEPDRGDAGEPNGGSLRRLGETCYGVRMGMQPARVLILLYS